MRNLIIACAVSGVILADPAAQGSAPVVAPVVKPTEVEVEPIAITVKEKVAPVSAPANEKAAPVAAPAKEDTAPVIVPAQDDATPIVIKEESVEKNSLAEKTDKTEKTDEKDTKSKSQALNLGAHDQFNASPTKFICGIVFMGLLICVSNAGGLSGAGSIIPIMLICFDMDMSKAVPVSAFVAVVSTTLRFIINFKQLHPHNKGKLSLNYDIVTLVMPSVFMGSMVGVQLGQIIGPTWQTIVFGITVAWSIYTSGKKCLDIIAKEKKAAEQNANNESTSLLKTDDQMEEEDDQVEGAEVSADLKSIKHEESHHFTIRRFIYTLVCFLALFFTSKYYKETKQVGILVAFGIFTLVVTIWAVRDTVSTHEIKERDGYKFVASDIIFSKTPDVVKLAFFCAIAAVLCGMTGIAGGMVLGPLFLSYNMLPQVMSATNQYITMIASFSVVIQFMMSHLLSTDYAVVFGVVSFFSALTGIVVVNRLVQKSGKQSIIAILLTAVLVVALVSLPVNYFLKKAAAA